MHSRSPVERSGQRGSVTAEFATVMPAVILVLAACLSGIQLGSGQLRMQDAASAAARSAARGEHPAAVVAGVVRLVPGASVHRFTRGDLACVKIVRRAPLAGGLGPAITLSVTSCALTGGR